MSKSITLSEAASMVLSPELASNKIYAFNLLFVHFNSRFLISCTSKGNSSSPKLRYLDSSFELALGNIYVII